MCSTLHFLVNLILHCLKLFIKIPKHQAEAISRLKNLPHLCVSFGVSLQWHYIWFCFRFFSWSFLFFSLRNVFLQNIWGGFGYQDIGSGGGGGSPFFTLVNKMTVFKELFLVVIAQCRVRHGKYFPSFSYFVTEIITKKIEKRKIIANITWGNMR